MPEREPEMRPIWSGTITFGLVNVPVNLYPAVQPRGVRLRMLDEDGTPLARRYVCPEHGKPVDWDQIVRGYAVEKDRWVVVKDEEVEALEPEKTRDINIRRFVDVAEVHPFYFERPYYLAPSGSSNHAYRLLARAMEEEGKAGVATFVMRDKEYLVAVLSENGILRAQILRFADEIRTPQQVGLPEPKAARAAQRAKIEKAIRQREKDRLAPAAMQDDLAVRVIKLIEKKRRADRDVVTVEASEESKADFVDLMAVLKRKMAEAA